MIYRLLHMFPDKQGEQEAADRLLAYALKHEYAITYDKKDIKRNEWGKPYISAFPQIFYSVSHSARSVAVMLGESRVGVDTEFVRNHAPAVVKRVCSESESEYIHNAQDRDSAFFRLWTLKESYIKALGVGMTFPLKNACFSITRDLSVETMLCDACFKLFETESGIVTAACVMNGEQDSKSFVLHDVQYGEI